MSNPSLARISIADFIEQFRAEMVPFSNTFSYFFAGLPLTEEDVKEYIEEPVSALPPEIVGLLPKSTIILVPFLQGVSNGKAKRHTAAPGMREFIVIERPADNKLLPKVAYRTAETVHLIFAVKDVDMADYHYNFYREIATLAEARLSDSQRAEYNSLLREELGANVHGEVDEASWHLKQGLRRRGANVRRDSKGFREYARLSFIDTLTLYLHGICCDIDVEPGPRQLPSRYLRKRLTWLEAQYPPPPGYYVFPEEEGKASG
ncbi:MAG: hypothetical protein NZV14_19045 [Bryobacteraceae bacterium]|nr:hypothetical protein [Bryobacteraceae bacterium]MDW8380263.1 hypothetical protein [Bryobacterales bacterium]